MLIDPSILAPTLWQRPQDIVGAPDIDSWANGGGTAGGTFVGVGAARPQRTSIGSEDCADFVVGSSDVITSALTIATVVGSGAWAFFGVLRADDVISAAGSIWLSEGWLADVGGYWGIFTRLVAGVPKVAAYQYDGAVRIAEGTITKGLPTMIQARWSGAGNPIRLRVGAAAETTSVASGNISVTASALREGRGATGAGAFCDGVLAEPMCFAREVTDSEAAQLRAYYAARYGVAT